MQVEPSSPGAGAIAESFRCRVDDEVERMLAERRDRVAELAPEALVLIDEIARLFRSGGKRLRPLFCFWGHLAGGGADGQPIVRAAAAVEVLHLSALMHDDVMDRAHLRRGAPPSFRLLAGSATDPGSFGQAAAILAGDLAHALADELLSESGFPAERVVRALAHFHEMRVQAVSGEYLDLLSARERRMADREGGEGRARRVAALKSGSYSVTGPLLLGAALADAPATVMEALAAFGRPLGEAFQLQDDVLGTFGDPAVTGKDRDTDILEGKHTMLVAKSRELGDDSARRVLDERLGRRDLRAEEVEEVRTIMRDSGALEATLALVRELAEQATMELSRVPLAPVASAGLAELSDQVAFRDV
jgi:geranylgeranyl diphosphate synthase type I